MKFASLGRWPLRFAVLCWAASPAWAADPRMEATLETGTRALYNLNYAQSRSIFQELIEAEPESPYGYLFRAGALWWQASNEYDLFKDTPTLEGLFESDVDNTIRTAQALTRSSDSVVRAEGYYLGGMALGARGQWHLIRGRWIKAYVDGKKAVRHLNKCLKLNEDFYDAYLGLGVYDYQAARLPGILKLSALLMVRGDAERGVQRLHLAEEKGRFSAVQSAMFLINIYMGEGGKRRPGLAPGP